MRSFLNHPRDHNSTTSLSQSQPQDPAVTSSSDTTTSNVVDVDVADQDLREDLKTVTTRRSLPAFSVSLTREKIEADLLAMGVGGGSKRRAKSVQQRLDHLFPTTATGLRFKKITPHDYRVLRRIRD